MGTFPKFTFIALYMHVVLSISLMFVFDFLLDQGPGLFEPIHGSAPDIAGQVSIFYFHFSLSFCRHA